MTFKQNKESNNDQHGQRNLCRAGQIGSGNPCCIYGYCKSLHTQKLGCSDVVQGFKQGQADPYGNGWAGHGQGHPEKYTAA